MKAKGRNFVCLTAKPETTKPSKTKPAEKIDGFVSGLRPRQSGAFQVELTRSLAQRPAATRNAGRMEGPDWTPAA